MAEAGPIVISVRAFSHRRLCTGARVLWALAWSVALLAGIGLTPLTARPARAQESPPPAADAALAEPATANPQNSIHFERVLSVDAGKTAAYAAAGNFIYVGQGTSIATVDVSNSNDPLLVGRSASLGGLIRHIAVDGSYLYVAAEEVGLIVLDATQPEKLREVARFAVKRASVVAVEQGRAYVGDDWNGLLILDVGQPASPRLLGTLHVAYAIYGVSIANQRAFISLGWNGLMAADVAAAAAPKKLAHWRDLRTWQRVEFAGQYASIVLDGESLHLYDLSDLKSPKELATVSNVDFSMMGGRYVYAGGWAGLQVWDLINPVRAGFGPVD